MNNKKIITITTDFGDHFSLAQIKGEIFKINPEVNIITAANDVSPYNIPEGAFIIKEIVNYSPERSIHIGVVDPGVGTKRQAIIAICNQATFVGPNNGLFYPAIKKYGLQKLFIIDCKKINPKHSTTFHGRDVFARTAARLSLDENPNNLGSETSKDALIKLLVAKNQILYIDDYGNIKINAKQIKQNLHLGDCLKIIANQKIIKASFQKTFSLVPKGQWLCYDGSNGYLELAINQGNAAKKLGVKVGDILKIKRV